ncbi:MAG: hypothetical protein NVS9B15_16000 [Acidobacteriaceae bacterium]
MSATRSRRSTTAVGPSTSFPRRMLLGFGSVGLGQIIAAVQAIFFVPFFLHAWGQTVYGHWLALTALVSYLTLLDLGGQNYVGNLLTIDYARGEMDSLRRTASGAISLFIAISLVATLVLVCFLFGVSPLLWRSGHGPFAMPGSHWIVLFSAVGLLLTIPGGVYVTVYRATGMFVRGQMLGNAIRLAELAVYATFLTLAVSPVVFALTVMAGAIVRTAIITYDIYAHTPVLALQISPRLAWKGRIYLKGSVSFWLMSLSTALNQQGVLLVVASLAGASTVAMFATHRTAAGLIAYVSTLTLAPLWPELSRLWAQERQSEMRGAALIALRLVVLASGFAALILWISLPLVYPIWTGRHLRLHTTILAIVLIQAVLASGWSTTAWSLLAANRQRLPALWSVANACATIVLAVWWGTLFGVVGVALASLAGDVLCGFAIFPVFSSRFLQMPARHLYKEITFPIVWLIPLAAFLLCSARVLSAWFLAVECTLGIVLWLPPAARFGLGPDGRRWLGAALHALRRPA